MDNASDAGGVRFTDFNPVRTNGHIAFGAPLSADWSVSTFDVKHAFSASFLYARFGKRLVYLANALTNQQIGLEETDDGLWSLYFHSVLLATLDERDYIIQS